MDECRSSSRQKLDTTPAVFRTPSLPLPPCLAAPGAVALSGLASLRRTASRSRVLALSVLAFVAGAANAGEVTIAWTDNSTDETGFNVERAIGADGEFISIGIAPPDTTTYTDTTLNGESALYRYRVSAISPWGESEYTNPILDISAPVATGLADVSTTEGSAIPPLSFAIADATKPLASLVLTASSDNPALIPSTAITLGGSGANRTITLSPVANTSGTGTITVTISNGVTSNSFAFTVTVLANAGNAAPTLSPISNQSIPVDGNTGAIGFSISDAETAANLLQVSAATSNPALLPLSGITFAGTANSRSLTITPAAGQSGSGLITVTVSDGFRAASRSFTVVVNPNTAPTVSAITDVTIAAGTSTQPLAFTVSDAQTIAQNLTVTVSSSNPALTPSAGMVLGGSGANRTLQVTPATGHSGAATITIAVSDGALTATEDFSLTVTNASTGGGGGGGTGGGGGGGGGGGTGGGGGLPPPSGTPPSFTTHPTSKTVLAGTSVALTASAAGSPAPVLQWRRNGVTIAGATSSTYTISSAGPDHAGTYTVSATNSSGSATSSAAVLTVVSAPAITSHPASQLLASGQSATFAVSATGSGTLTYQWRKDSAIIAGATDTTLVLPDVQPEAAGTYDVVVANEHGTTTSNSAILAVRTTTIAGSYFGTLSGGGTWAIYIRPDRTGTYVAYLPDRESGVVVDFTIDANGNFTVVGLEMAGTNVRSASSSPRTSAAPATFTLSGRISGTQITGELTGLAKTFTGAAAVGPETPRYFETSALGASSQTLYTVVGANGAVLTLAVAEDAVDAAAGMINAGGLQTTTFNGSPVVLAVSSHGILATYQPTGSSRTISFVGVDDSVPVTTRLVNISARSRAGVGNDTLVAGFAVAGSGTTPVLVRGSGPALADFGVPGTLADPMLGVYTSGNLLTTNDDWSAATNAPDVASTASRVNAFPLSNGGKDAALLTSLAEGVYTAQITGKADGTGVALVEVYDTADTATARLVNVSARTWVGTGSDVLVVGFSIQGNAPKKLLVRAVGPTLGSFGVSGALADPQLAVVPQGSSVPVEQNDNWGGGPTLRSAFEKVYAFPLAEESKDAAVAVTLQPGAYSIVVSGVGNLTGIALVELYELP